MKIFKTNNQLETIEVGKKIGNLLNPGDVCLLIGDLSAGKTTITKGIGMALGVKKVINSPTFTIVNEYKNEKATIYHFDVYRLADIDEFYAIGGPEYFEKGICIIEWGELILDALPKEYIKIEILKDAIEENTRHIKINKN